MFFLKLLTNGFYSLWPLKNISVFISEHFRVLGLRHNLWTAISASQHSFDPEIFSLFFISLSYQDLSSASLRFLGKSNKNWIYNKEKLGPTSKII